MAESAIAGSTLADSTEHVVDDRGSLTAEIITTDSAEDVISSNGKHRSSSVKADSTESLANISASITTEHIKQLIETNNALRESVVSIATLLQEQVRQRASYPEMVENPAVPRILAKNGSVLQGDPSRRATNGARFDREERRKRYEESWEPLVPMSEDAVESERVMRRQIYEGHWTATENPEKYVEICPTLLSYDDPWWDVVSCQLREVSMVDQPQSRKLDFALRGGLRYDLFIALFGLEFNYKWSNASRYTFEDSRRFRLGQIIHKLQDTGAISYFGGKFAYVLIEVAEWTKTVWTRNPEGSQTLESLRNFCYLRRVLDQPKSSDYRSAELQNEGLISVLYALDFRKWWSIGGSWQRVVSELNTNDLPLEALISTVDQFTGWPEKSRNRVHICEPSKNMSVDPSDLNSRAIRDLGDIQIVWTPELDMHLKLSLDGKRLFVFQYPTWLIGRRFNEITHSYADSSDGSDSNKVFHDLAETYALLFGPNSIKEATQLMDVLQNTECNAHFLGVPLWRPALPSTIPISLKVHLHPEHPPTRNFLENFRSLTPPYSMEPAEGFTTKNPTMADVLRSGQPYSEDMTIMMLSILRYYPLSGSFNWSGSHFEEQLRMLKAYMDGKKPRTIGQLWRDARDATSWWTFWAVLFFGISSLVLALGALIVSVVQTVGTFRALG